MNPEYRRKQRDRFAIAVLGSGLMGKLDPAVAVRSMFDIAELIMQESERRHEADRDRVQDMQQVQAKQTKERGKFLPKNRQTASVRSVVPSVQVKSKRTRLPQQNADQSTEGSVSSDATVE